jgi:thiamine biosynthesis protein ThiS
MRLTVNGEPREVEVDTVAALVQTLGLDLRKVAVERNLEIVPKSLFDRIGLAEGDQIEIVHFIGGG